MRIQTITMENLEAYREIRLAALKTDPMAFGSTYARESTLSKTDWQQRALSLDGRDRIGFFAVDDDTVCGLVLCFRSEVDATVGTVISMWVSPEARRKGAGSALLHAVAEWAAAHGMPSLRLFVLADNARAIALYEKNGYRKTGRTQPYPNDESLTELEMERTACSALLRSEGSFGAG
jgi:ribosomal protein S18 acetylase RimI-like enzyme